MGASGGGWRVKLDVMWRCAPFGIISFGVWCYKYATMHRLLRQIVTEVEVATGRRDDKLIGRLYAPRMLEVYGLKSLTSVVLSQVKVSRRDDVEDGFMDDFVVVGDAFYVGVFIHLLDAGLLGDPNALCNRG